MNEFKAKCKMCRDAREGKEYEAICAQYTQRFQCISQEMRDIGDNSETGKDDLEIINKLQALEKAHLQNVLQAQMISMHFIVELKDPFNYKFADKMNENRKENACIINQINQLIEELQLADKMHLNYAILEIY